MPFPGHLRAVRSWSNYVDKNSSAQKVYLPRVKIGAKHLIYLEIMANIAPLPGVSTLKMLDLYADMQEFSGQKTSIVYAEKANSR